MKQKNKHAAALGRIKSAKKAAASRANGKLGGRRIAERAAIMAVAAQACADRSAMEGSQ